MKTRPSIKSALLVVVAVAALGACGSTDTAVEPQDLPTVSTTVRTTTVEPVVPEATSVQGADSTAPQPDAEETSVVASIEPERAEAAPASGVPGPAPSLSAQPDPATFLGPWQRHASVLNLADDPNLSTFSMGVSCCDTENWSVTWTPDSDGVIVTLVEQTALYGQGVYGELFEGKTFRASPSVGSNGVPVLVTYGLGDDPGISTWCRSGSSVPECGA